MRRGTDEREQEDYCSGGPAAKASSKCNRQQQTGFDTRRADAGNEEVGFDKGGGAYPCTTFEEGSTGGRSSTASIHKLFSIRFTDALSEHRPPLVHVRAGAVPILGVSTHASHPKARQRPA